MQSLFAALFLAIASALACLPAAAAQYKNPISFYVARGMEGACGPGCDEWIAADGSFDPGSASRLKQFLSRLPSTDLPIFFHSRGGLVREAIWAGTVVRSYKMTSGVGKTRPEACGEEKSCGSTKRAGQPVRSSLRINEGLCASACVLALMGGETRYLVPGVKVGIHASSGLLLLANGDVAPTQNPRYDAMVRGYVRTMGIEASFIDEARKVPHSRMKYLTWEELARFGLRKEPSPSR